MTGQSGPVLIDEATAEQIFTHVIWNGLSQHQRNVITEQLLAWLVSAPPTAHGIAAGLSPLQRAMRDAVGKVINQAAEKVVAEHAELLEQIQELANAEVRRAIAGDQSGLGGRIRLAVARELADQGLRS